MTKLNLEAYRYKVLIDEFHNILDNYGFRKIAIDGMLTAVRQFNHVTYMSATPIDEMFIPDSLKEEPYTVIEWGSSFKVEVNSLNVHNPIQTGLTLIKQFRSLKGLEFTQINGSTERVEELYIYVNSVKDIATICKSIGLDSNEVKIVCSDKLKNIRTLDELNLSISNISDPNKKINFFTSKAFAGANLFSNNALVIVISNSDKRHTLIDLQTSLYQIYGRLRKNSKFQNIFRHMLIHINSTIQTNHPSWNLKYFKEKAEEKINEKISNSNSLITAYKKLSEGEKAALKDQFMAKTYFADYNEIDDTFELSNMMINFAKYQYNLMYNIYSDGLSVCRGYSEDHFEVSTVGITKKNNLEIKLATTFDFKKLLKEYIELRIDNSEQDLIDKFKNEYPIFEEAYVQIGVAGISSLNYSRLAIERYLKIYSTMNLGSFMNSLFKGHEISSYVSKKELKSKFINFLKTSSIEISGVGITTSKILNHLKGFVVNPKQRRINGKREHGFEIKRSDNYLLEMMGIFPMID